MKNREKPFGVSLSFLSQAISIAVGLIYTPIMIRILGQNEYGLYQLVLSLVNYLHLMNFGFSGAYIRYYSIAKTKEDNDAVSKVNGMFLTVFTAISALCLIAGGFLYANIQIFGTKLTAADYAIAKKLLVLMVINLTVSFPNSLLTAYMFANEKFVFFQICNIIVNIALPLLKLPLLLLGFGSVGVIGATLFLTIVRFLVNWLYCKMRLHMKIHYGYFDKAIFADLMKFTFFIFLSDLVDQLNSNVDKLLLGRMVGTIAVAVYSVAYNLKTYYTTMSWIVPEMYIPAVNRAVIEENSSERTNQLFVRIGRINNYIMLLIISGFVVFGRAFISLWVGEAYDTSFYATLILMVAGYIPAVQTLGPNIQNAKNMHQVRSIVYFAIACINIILSVVLIRVAGVIGTCWGTLIAIFLGHGLFMNIYYHKRIGLNIFAFWKALFKWYPYVIFLCAGALWLTKNTVFTSWFALSGPIILFVGIYALLLCCFGLESGEKQALLLKIKSVLTR